MPRTASLNSIEKKIRELQAKAEALKNQEKPGIKQLKILLRKYKLDIHDVKLALGTNAEKTSRLKGRKIAPKYRNPNNKKETWSGRGRQPLWVVAALKQGKKIEDLAI